MWSSFAKQAYNIQTQGRLITLLWHKRFCDGGELVEDIDRSGLSSTSRNEGLSTNNFFHLCDVLFGCYAPFIGNNYSRKTGPCNVQRLVHWCTLMHRPKQKALWQLFDLYIGLSQVDQFWEYSVNSTWHDRGDKRWSTTAVPPSVLGLVTS